MGPEILAALTRDPRLFGAVKGRCRVGNFKSTREQSFESYRDEPGGKNREEMKVGRT